MKIRKTVTIALNDDRFPIRRGDRNPVTPHGWCMDNCHYGCEYEGDGVTCTDPHGTGCWLNGLERRYVHTPHLIGNPPRKARHKDPNCPACEHLKRFK